MSYVVTVNVLNASTNLNNDLNHENTIVLIKILLRAGNDKKVRVHAKRFYNFQENVHGRFSRVLNGSFCLNEIKIKYVRFENIQSLNFAL